MCGIIGTLDTNGVNRELFYSQLQQIAHRGPDEEGVWFNARSTIALGSKRLRIQDLSPNGRMPMHDQSNLIHIVYNGEVYNFHKLKSELQDFGYSFKSRSDTEVILQSYLAYGAQFVKKLVGMFSIAIYDESKDLLLLARDRAGEKPLYYWKNKRGISFASELKSLMQDPTLDRVLNLEAFREYLANGYCTGERSFIEDVKKLPAGHILIYNSISGNTELSSYWELGTAECPQMEEEDLLIELESLLERSIKGQLIADVPVGILLSGGIDSSLITAIAAKNSSEKIKTFHVSFSGQGSYNERAYARIVAEHFDCEHFELEGQDLTPSHLEEVLDYLDEPMADSSLLPTFMVTRLARSYVTVALGGDGGDELFGGYHRYQKMMEIMHQRNVLPSKLSSLLGSIGSSLPVGLKGRNYLRSMGGTALASLEGNIYFDSENFAKVLDPKMYSLTFAESNSSEGNHSSELSENDLIRKACLNDFRTYLVDDILVKVDRMSMAHSLEMRAPWLDKDIVEFAFKKVPLSLKVNNKEKKILPRRLAKKLLPATLDINRKQGFSIPLSQWMATSWRSYFLEQFNSYKTKEIFNLPFIINLLKLERSQYFTNNKRIFLAFIFLRWFEKYQIRLPAPED